jgi:hypothetical protein
MSIFDHQFQTIEKHLSLISNADNLESINAIRKSMCLYKQDRDSQFQDLRMILTDHLTTKEDSYNQLNEEFSRYLKRERHGNWLFGALVILNIIFVLFFVVAIKQ